jgi:CheY-like chemotaxis protein
MTRIAHRPILVVTPEPGIQAVIRYLFESQGQGVVTAGDWVTARRRLAEMKPRAILLELVLDGADGLELLAELKSSPGTAAIPTFVTTGRARKSDRARAIRAGAVDLLTRPFDEREILDRLAAGAAGETNAESRAARAKAA